MLLSIRSEVNKGQRGVLFGWCRVYGRELLVQIDDNDMRRVGEMVVHLSEVG